MCAEPTPCVWGCVRVVEGQQVRGPAERRHTDAMQAVEAVAQRLGADEAEGVAPPGLKSQHEGAC